MGRILIVEDEDSIVKALTLKLSLKEHELFVANNGDEAISKVRSHNFDIVLLDIILPGRSGIEVLEVIDNLSHKPKVIILSELNVTDLYKKIASFSVEQHYVKSFLLLSKLMDHIDLLMDRIKNEATQMA